LDSAETVFVNDPIISCDGGDGLLGHPKVHLKMGSTGKIDCPYCGKHYVFQDSNLAEV